MKNLCRYGILLPGLLWTAVPALAASCDSLTSLNLPHVTIDSAETIAAGQFNPPAAGGRGGGGGNAYADLPEFCRVQATSRPTADSDIKIEVWLPARGWNGKFEANGNGGWTGSISANTLADGMRRGYAAAMTDTGHQGGSASFAMGHPEKLIDFGHRSIHELAVVGKAVTEAFYDSEVRYSYWNGCSAGGRQGLKAAQMYPEDFDGIVAGSPGAYWTGRALQSVWIGQATHESEAHMIPAEKFEVIHQAALEACDGKNGDSAADGVLDDPRLCGFDPATIQCAAGAATDSCLTSEQVETARRIYSDVTNPSTGKIYFAGHEPGSELGWRTMAGANPFGPGVDLFRYIVYEDEDWDYMTLTFDEGAEAALAADRAADAFDPDLADFFANGGKIVQYHGWSDPQISPATSVMYYENVMREVGSAETKDHHRLFMVPGMAHCGGGEGTSSFDMLTVLEKWVEEGEAPDSVMAERVADGEVNRTRPLCPYPQVAKYDGSGSVDDAANFACVAP